MASQWEAWIEALAHQPAFEQTPEKGMHHAFTFITALMKSCKTQVTLDSDCICILKLEEGKALNRKTGI